MRFFFTHGVLESLERLLAGEWSTPFFCGDFSLDRDLEAERSLERENLSAGDFDVSFEIERAFASGEADRLTLLRDLERSLDLL